MAKLKKCKHCGSEVAKSAKSCPSCGGKIKKPFYKAVWFWIIIAIILIASAAAGTGSNESSEDEEIKYQKNKKNKITIVDMSQKTDAEIDSWCNENKINCVTMQEYSDIVEKGGFVRQSIEADKVVYEGEKIILYYSLGKEPTVGQKNALEKAESYSEHLNMSKKGIYKQLTSEYGEGFTKEEAQYAIDNMTADWKYNALQKAKSYQENLHMSKKNIYKQLISQYGEQFTKEEAQYAIDHLDD